jgi:C4-dicarboxylate transporter DctM subunit
MILLLFGSFFLMVFLNVPVAVALGVSSIAGLLAGGYSLTTLPDIMSSSIGKFTLLAIPFFILAGVIMEYAGISRRLVRFAKVCVGHTRGGLIVVVVVVSCFFAAISGSGPATVAALGSILVPMMIDAGYDPGVSTALMSASGAIGIVIPPSIAFVIFASISGCSVGKLFSGGIIPGILMGAAYVVAALYSSRGASIKPLPKASKKERWDAFKDAFWGLLTPVIILGGIYGGIFTATESAGVAIVYGLFVGIFVYREIKPKDLYKLFVDAAVSSGTVLYIVACASVFAWLMTTTHIATDLSEALMSLSSNSVVLLLLINLIFLIAGCFLDASSAFYILVPIVLPVATQIGIDPVQLGVVLTVNMAVGLITPPVGINLYVGCSITNMPVAQLCKKIVPFVVAGVVVILLTTFISPLSMFLPGLMK